MQNTAHPLRVRLYGGRAVHAAHKLPISGGHETACEYFIDARASNHWLDNDPPVTCARCEKVLKREAVR
ncbi:hypothetical protein D8771_09300 [Streptomyces albus]|uniref:Uncharacterized protein n=1 Tax=Streptomyces albus TaxID=1888 RepID=A0A8H1LJV0_9ACTN|nr:hypothetical protein D8771_09300 [Streptomyces albus]GHJ19047.1 hypothetical protein TPA0909_06610 [Streptomyces albus]